MVKKDKTTLLVKLLTKSFYPFWPPLYVVLTIKELLFWITFKSWKHFSLKINVQCKKIYATFSFWYYYWAENLLSFLLYGFNIHMQKPSLCKMHRLWYERGKKARLSISTFISFLYIRIIRIAFVCKIHSFKKRIPLNGI